MRARSWSVHISRHVAHGIDFILGPCCMKEQQQPIQRLPSVAVVVYTVQARHEGRLDSVDSSRNNTSSYRSCKGSLRSMLLSFILSCRCLLVSSPPSPSLSCPCPAHPVLLGVVYTLSSRVSVHFALLFLSCCDTFLKASMSSRSVHGLGLPLLVDFD